MKKKAFLIAKV